MNLKQKIADKPLFYKIDFREKTAVEILATRIYNLLPRMHEQPIIIVCIGTDRSTGDALGPLVGSKLRQKQRPACHVYGTLEKPVHAVNLEKELENLRTHHLNPYVIGIDASLGKLNNVGKISLGKGPVKPGAGVNKQLPSVGDAHLTGIVNVSGCMEYFVLQNTRLHLVTQMADTMADSLHAACLRREASLPPKRQVTHPS